MVSCSRLHDEDVCERRTFAPSARRTLRWAPGAALFKTLNQIGADNMDKAALFPLRPVMFVAGDDVTRKPLVMSLIAKLGFQAIDAGSLRTARPFEAYGILWID
jgi:8-hydroxy-5-deazaflavin:NADPH oxidoreductase